MKISQGNKYLGLEEKFWTFFRYVFRYIHLLKFSREGYKIRKVFVLELPVVKWNYQVLIIGGISSCQKLDITLQNWCFQKMSITKNMPPNLYSSMKKNQKDLYDFWQLDTTTHMTKVNFFSPNTFNFVPLSWKLHNQHCHKMHM